MNAVFEPPYNKRKYPSPRAGRYVNALIKEMPLDEYPAKFVRSRRAEVAASGGTLFTERVGGMRAWHPSEHANTFGSGIDIREQPWSDVWQLDTAEAFAVLDVLKYTEFYDADSMDRFSEFEGIAAPILGRFDGRVTQSCAGGVGVWLRKSPSLKEWKQIANEVAEFNRKYFSSELPEPRQRRRKEGEYVLWFGDT